MAKTSKMVHNLACGNPGAGKEESPSSTRILH